MNENEIMKFEPTSEELDEAFEEAVTEQAEEIAPLPEKNADSETVENMPSSEEFAKMGGLEKYYLLRRLGFSHEDAAVATGGVGGIIRGKGHLRSAVAATAKSPTSAMPARDLAEARAIFADLTDAQIQNLYKKVTK